MSQTTSIRFLSDDMKEEVKVTENVTLAIKVPTFKMADGFEANGYEYKIPINEFIDLIKKHMNAPI